MNIEFEELTHQNYEDTFWAERFYLRHGFTKTDVMEGNDHYYLRFPD